MRGAFSDDESSDDDQELVRSLPPPVVPPRSRSTTPATPLSNFSDDDLVSTSEDEDIDDEFDPTAPPRTRSGSGRRSLIATISARRSASRASKKAVTASTKPALDNGARVQELLRECAGLASPEAVASAQREIVALLGKGSTGILSAEKLMRKLIKAESRVDRRASRSQTRKSGVAKLLRARHSPAIHRTPTVTRTLAVGGGSGAGRSTTLDLAYVLTSPRVIALRFAPELAEAEHHASSPPGERQNGATATTPAPGGGASARGAGGLGGGDTTARFARYFMERHRGCCRFYNAAGEFVCSFVLSVLFCFVSSSLFCFAHFFFFSFIVAAAEFTYPRSFLEAMKAAGCGVSNAFALERLLCPTIETAAAFCRDAHDWLSRDWRHSIAVHGGSRWASESRSCTYIASLLIFCGICKSGTDALDIVDRRRAAPGERAVEWASHRRFVEIGAPIRTTSR